MNGGPKSSLRPFLHRALQLLSYYISYLLAIVCFCSRSLIFLSFHFLSCTSQTNLNYSIVNLIVLVAWLA